MSAIRTFNASVHAWCHWCGRITYFNQFGRCTECGLKA